MKLSARKLCCTLSLAIAAATGTVAIDTVMSPPAAQAEEAWKEKIMELCAKTDVSMSLSVQELKELIAGCDKLKPVIDSLEESPRKVYGKRLQMCRDLFVYVLESKTKEATK